MTLTVIFTVFSGHKMYAPMGIGVLREGKFLEAIPPYQSVVK